MLGAAASRPSPAMASPATPAMAGRRCGPRSTSPMASRSTAPATSLSPTAFIMSVAGTTGRAYYGDGGPAVAAVFEAPKEMALDPDGNVLIVATENHAIRLIDRNTGIVTTIAGGRQGARGDGGPAAGAGLDRPHGVVVGPDGAIYIGDTNNHRIRKLVRRG